MFDFKGLLKDGIANFFASIFEELIKFFGATLADIMSTSMNVLTLPLVQNGIRYAQALAFTLLILKSISEAIQTYIMYQNGDPESDPVNLIIRTAQAVAIIATLPWIVQQIFTFGNKVASDVGGLSTGKAGVEDWTVLTTMIVQSKGTIVAILAIIIAILLLIVAIQATIRGAELALMSVLGPIMALNLTANNRGVWSAWFKQIVIICTSQALQIFMLNGALSLLTSKIISGNGMLLIFGWLWVTIKSPKYVQQIAYSTGLSGTIGGTAKQAGSMALMRKMMAKG